MDRLMKDPRSSSPTTFGALFATPQTTQLTIATSRTFMDGLARLTLHLVAQTKPSHLTGGPRIRVAVAGLAPTVEDETLTVMIEARVDLA